jgi:hypothetical protein
MYCSRCGAKLIEGFVGAENCVDIDGIPLYNKYSRNDGKRLYVKSYKCPKSRWYNNHDNFTSGGVLLKEDCDAGTN